MIKQTMVNFYMKYYLLIKVRKKIFLKSNNLDKSPWNYVEENKLISNGYILYDLICITFWNDKIIEIEK